MKAISYITGTDHEFQNQLVNIEKEIPTLKERDLLVKIHAISVNPVDTKVRQGKATPDNTRILGWDAVGEVIQVGSRVQHYKMGDQVWYAGDLTRDGSNAEFQAVDERIVGFKPQAISNAEAAAFPLTAITAWEMLFDRLNVDINASDTILIIGGAGGVGSIAIQLVKAITELKVIATASREETKTWVKSLGADDVIDHSQDLNKQIQQLGLAAPRYVFSTNHTSNYLQQITQLIAPEGKLGLIDDPNSLDIVGLKHKAVSVHWEFMFTRSMFSTHDIEQQKILLDEVAKLIDSKKIKTTLNLNLGKINAENLTQAHRLIETGKVKGKIVLEGF